MMLKIVGHDWDFLSVKSEISLPFHLSLSTPGTHIGMNLTMRELEKLIKHLEEWRAAIYAQAAAPPSA